MTLPLVVALVVFYLFFQPVSITLLLTTRLGLRSIWMVVPFTALLNGIGYLFLIRRVNWNELAYFKNKELAAGKKPLKQLP